MTGFDTLLQQLLQQGLLSTEDTEDTAPSPHAAPLARQLREALLAKMEDVYQNPVWCPIPGCEPAAPAHEPTGDYDDLFSILDEVAPEPAAASIDVDAEGTARIPLDFDTDDVWRGQEKELLDALNGSIDELVYLLTPAQLRLLQSSPRELLSLHPAPIMGKLAEVETRQHGGRAVPVEAVVVDLPAALDGATHFALVPNLTPLRRMKRGLDLLCDPACPDALAPLQALLGLSEAPAPASPGPLDVVLLPGERLDADQRACVHAVRSTPHFALVKGPPGSGKTTVIRAIIEREVRAGHRVLVVSPTHVAVDNVTEKLWPAPGADPARDRMARHTLPVRWASRDGKLSAHARQAWQSSQRDVRATQLALRLEDRLRTLPALAAWWGRLDENKRGTAPLSQAISDQRAVVCGTPIGILSAPDFDELAPGAFDLLIVDEVSKLTLPEFLAVAVYARRWALIGDPDQLPPYLDAREAAVCFADAYGPLAELAASVTTLIEARPPSAKDELRLAVVSNSPDDAAAAIRLQMRRAETRAHLPVHTLQGRPDRLAHLPGILVCAPAELSKACALLAPRERRSWRHSGHRAHPPGTVAILAQRGGMGVERPEVGSGCRLVEDRERAAARMVGLSHDLLHTLPWAEQVGVRPPSLGRRKGFPKLLPQLLEADARSAAFDEMARLYALLGVSVYDWLDGLPDAAWPAGPLGRVPAAMTPAAGLRRAVAPWALTLRTQYRMVPELSAVPRALFYDGKALQDGRRDCPRGGARLVQVDSDSRGEDNREEAARILADLDRVRAGAVRQGRQVEVLLITPYRKQERLLRAAVADWQQATRPHEGGGVAVEVCTLDRCQGREAEMVMVSLVRRRASAFLDNPKRWNVALTRARDHLIIYGDIRSYLRDVRDPHATRGPRQSVVTTFLRAFVARSR